MPSLAPTHKSSVKSLSAKSTKSTQGPAPSRTSREENRGLRVFTDAL